MVITFLERQAVLTKYPFSAIFAYRAERGIVPQTYKKAREPSKERG
jgi:hypothetical protein